MTVGANSFLECLVAVFAESRYAEDGFLEAYLFLGAAECVTELLLPNVWHRERRTQYSESMPQLCRLVTSSSDSTSARPHRARNRTRKNPASLAAKASTNEDDDKQAFP